MKKEEFDIANIIDNITNSIYEETDKRKEDYGKQYFMIRIGFKADKKIRKVKVCSAKLFNELGNELKMKTNVNDFCWLWIEHLGKIQTIKYECDECELLDGAKLLLEIRIRNIWHSKKYTISYVLNEEKWKVENKKYE